MTSCSRSDSDQPVVVSLELDTVLCKKYFVNARRPGGLKLPIFLIFNNCYLLILILT